MTTQPALIPGMPAAQAGIHIEYDNGALLVYTPWNPHFVEQLKIDVPGAERKWDAARKVWRVSPKRGRVLQAIIRQHYGVIVALPEGQFEPQPEVRLLDCRYIGVTKERGVNGESAFGWSNGDWSIIFPRRVLQEWFGVETRPGESLTLYGVLGVQKDAAPEQVKKAFKRAAMQWHPDRCREPDAAQQFAAIREAYDILSDDGLRARYDIGLRLTAGARERHEAIAATGYRSPLRCGLILAHGREILGRFNVDAILQFEDITDSAGRVLVTSWVMGEDRPREEWVAQ